MQLSLNKETNESAMSASDLLYCRFCAEQKLAGEITDLLSDVNIRQEIVEKLSCFPSNSINFDLQSLPETICNLCYFSLSSSYEFFTKIKISQVVLSNLLSTNFKLEIEVENATKDGPVASSTAVKLENMKNVETNSSFVDYGIDFQSLDDESNHDSKPNFDALSEVSWSVYCCICKYCNMNFSSINSLRAHCKEIHTFCNGFKCADCHLEHDEFGSFVRHARKHRDVLIHYCEYCNVKLENDQHINTHTSNPYCQLCGETFPNKSMLQRHLKSYGRFRKKPRKKKIFIQDLLSYSGISPEHMVVESWADYPWVCRYCGTRVSDQALLRHHSREVHGKCGGASCVDCACSTAGFEEFVDHVVEHRPGLRSYCPYCNYKYDNDTLTHLTSHQLICSFCGESFPDQSSLNTHNSTYSERPKKKRKHALTKEDLTCSVCQKIAKSANNLRDHMKLHTERSRDFFCDRCGMSFYTKGALKAHILIHDNPDPQICKICKKSFISLSRLRKHVLTHSKERPFECTSCHRRFRLKTLLKSHMATHLDVMPFNCQYCSKTFRFKNVLRVHERQHTGSKPYSCQICKMEFFNWSNCDKHLRRKHGMTLAKSKMTPEGKVPLNPKSFKPRKLELEDVKEWTEQLLVPRKRGKKVTGADCMKNKVTY